MGLAVGLTLKGGGNSDFCFLGNDEGVKGRAFCETPMGVKTMDKSSITVYNKENGYICSSKYSEEKSDYLCDLICSRRLLVLRWRLFC